MFSVHQMLKIDDLPSFIQKNKVLNPCIFKRHAVQAVFDKTIILPLNKGVGLIPSAPLIGKRFKAFNFYIYSVENTLHSGPKFQFILIITHTTDNLCKGKINTHQKQQRGNKNHPAKLITKRHPHPRTRPQIKIFLIPYPTYGHNTAKCELHPQ